jgi:hypothetical protein
MMNGIFGGLKTEEEIYRPYRTESILYLSAPAINCRAIFNCPSGTRKRVLPDHGYVQARNSEKDSPNL